METDLEIMLKQDPVGKQKETNGDRPGNHVGKGSTRRETNGDRPGNHVGTGSCTRKTKGDKWRQTSKSY